MVPQVAFLIKVVQNLSDTTYSSTKYYSVEQSYLLGVLLNVLNVTIFCNYVSLNLNN